MSETPAVTVQEAHAALTEGESVLVDVREEWEWRQQRIPGAVLIPLKELPDRVTDIPSDRDVFVHCRMGGRSGKAVDYLVDAGRPRARNVSGGIEAWAAAGLPVE